MALPFGKGATDRAGVLDLENRAEEGVENHTAEGGKRRDNDVVNLLSGVFAAALASILASVLI